MMNVYGRARLGWRRGLALATTVLFAGGMDGRAADRPPNVIVIMPDQMRGQAMGVAGNRQIRTPNLDRLAAEGIYLPNTFANNPVCCPARATILTGRYPHGHGVIVNDLRLRESVVTLAERLAGAGYATGFVGKWHLDGGFRRPGYVAPGPRRQGFGFWAASVCDHRHFKGVYFRDTDEPIRIDRFEPEVWTDEALGFIGANRDRPFFLWWTCGPPHNPYAAPERYERLYDPETLELRPNHKPVPRFGRREDIAKYYAAITGIDDQVGRLTAQLDRWGLTDDTLIIFTSDHGDMLGSQGTAFKCKPWAESIRVPGILRYPRKIKPRQERDLLFSHVDLAPTILAYCGLEVPDDAHGRDLSKLLSGRPEADPEPEAVFFQIYEPRKPWSVPDAWRGVRTKGYVYARFEDKPWVLYDTARDPYELSNLVGQPSAAGVQARLDKLIEQEMARTGDTWAINLPEPVSFDRAPAVYRPSEYRPAAN